MARQSSLRGPKTALVVALGLLIGSAGALLIGACATGATDEAGGGGGGGAGGSAGGGHGGGGGSAAGGGGGGFAGGGGGSSAGGGGGGTGGSGGGGSQNGDGGSGDGASGDGAGGGGGGGAAGGGGGGGSACVTTPPGNACGLVPQCGCGASQTCDVTDLKGDVSCVNAGSNAEGSACNSTNNCAQGLTCSIGACKTFCSGSNLNAACPGSDAGTCVSYPSAALDGGTIPNANVCTINCNLEDPNSCGGTSGSPVAGCQAVSNSIVDCVTAGTGKQGANCNTAFCAPGFTCTIPSSGPDTCQQWCQVALDDCPGSLNCFGFQTAIIINGTEFGGCQ
jgi:hypothetical protein